MLAVLLSYLRQCAQCSVASVASCCQLKLKLIDSGISKSFSAPEVHHSAIWAVAENISAFASDNQQLRLASSLNLSKKASSQNVCVFAKKKQLLSKALVLVKSHSHMFERARIVASIQSCEACVT